MKQIILILFIITSFYYAHSQQVKVENAIPASNIILSPNYGIDYLITANKPIGPISGIQKQSNGTIYLAVNDTLSTSNLGLVIFQSTNNGAAWTLFGQGINTRVKYMNIKMVRTGLDSIYCFFQVGNNAFSWNFLTGNFKQFDSANVGYFDAVGSSTGSLYWIMNHVPLNQLRRYGSSDGGATWVNPGYIQVNGCMPKAVMSGSGDTIYLNYYSPVRADTAKSIIRYVRYRETAPATIASVKFQNVVNDTSVVKSEFTTVAYKGTSWFFYTTGTTGNINIKCCVCTVADTNYGPAFDIAANLNVDEYWLDARFCSAGNGGVDFTYYSDSLQPGNPNNNTDKLMTMHADVTTPNVFSTPTRVSNHPPGWSSAMYVPKIVELYTVGKVGMVWVGFDVSAYKLYWASDLLTSIENNGTPSKYSLSQNFPNPFNPVTRINFEIAKSGLVRLEIFDMLGREVQNLVNSNLSQGSYSINFDGSKLSSGVYFYRLDINGFSETKKMLLVK